jgi:hypothetical protein
VHAGDWNRDGWRDFLVCGPVSSPSRSLHLFQNDSGAATVPSDGLLGAAVASPQDAKLADLNGDGWDDLVVVTPRELQVRLNQACASCARFSQVDRRITLVDGVHVAVGDVTGDGFRDLYVVQGETANTNAPDLLLAGPDWRSLAMPQAEVGVGDTAEIIDIAGRQTVIVTNGSPHKHYSRGPVQFVSYRSTAPYDRPLSAPKVELSLVPAYAECVDGNALHGPPLAHPSCSPPAPASSQAALGRAGFGAVKLRAIEGDPDTGADEADVRIKARVTDVRNRTASSDYAGELGLVAVLRITDKESPPFSTTMSDRPLTIATPCTPTSDPAAGSTCDVATTADTVIPGAVREGARAIWQLTRIAVQDGGQDGVGTTTGDNTDFLKQGVFVP